MQELSEIQEFLLFLFEGILISFVFDFFRSLRNNFNSGDIATNIEDIVFLIMVSGIIIFSIIYLCSGIIRLYMFIGLIFGIVLYFLTIGNKCVIIIGRIMKFFKSFFTFLLKIVKKLGKLFNL